MPTNRLTEFGPAAVWRWGVCAGSIDSRNGKATVTPTPWRNVRRGMCFLVMNISYGLLYLHSYSASNENFVLVAISVMNHKDTETQRAGSLCLCVFVVRNGCLR